MEDELELEINNYWVKYTESLTKHIYFNYKELFNENIENIINTELSLYKKIKELDETYVHEQIQSICLAMMITGYLMANK